MSDCQHYRVGRITHPGEARWVCQDCEAVFFVPEAERDRLRDLLIRALAYREAVEGLPEGSLYAALS